MIMNTRSYIISFKKIYVYFKVFVECISYFGEFEVASSSSFQSMALTLETSPNRRRRRRRTPVSIGGPSE